MMNMTEFIEKLKEEIREYLPEDVRGDIIIDDVEVVKMNDQKLHGLTFRTPESDAAPTLYVDEMFSAYMDGKDISALTAELANMYTGSRDGVRPPEVKLSYDRVKDNLTVRLLEKKRNNEFLSSMPYVNVGHGLAVIRKYIRLTELIPEILDMVDDGVIALRPAVELSYIPRLKQGHIGKESFMTGNNRNNNGEITFEIVEHIGVLDVIDNREEKWTKEVNLVAWNGGKPKIDVRDWNSSHDRMGRGITLTEEQGEKLVKALGQRMLDKQKARTERDPYER